MSSGRLVFASQRSSEMINSLFLHVALQIYFALSIRVAVILLLCPNVSLIFFCSIHTKEYQRPVWKQQKDISHPFAKSKRISASRLERVKGYQPPLPRAKGYQPPVWKEQICNIGFSLKCGLLLVLTLFSKGWPVAF